MTDRTDNHASEKDRRATTAGGVHEAAANRRVYIGVGLVFAVLLLGYLVYEISVVVLVLLLTLLFTVIISGPVDYLERRGWRRGLGLLAVAGVAAVFFGGLGVVLAPIIEDQALSFAETFPSLLTSTQDFLERMQSALRLDLRIPLDSQGISNSVREFLSGGLLSTVAGFGAGVVNVLSLAAVVLIATLYSVLTPRPLVSGFVALFPARSRGKVRSILYEMYDTLQRWFMGQLASMLIIGVLWTVALFALGIPFAVLIGVFSAIVAFVPYIGAALSVVPPLLLALVEQPVLAVWVLVVYLGIQTVEGYVIQPIVMSRAVKLHPAVVIFAILVMGTLYGLVGVLLAVPLTAVVLVLVNSLWVSRMDALGDDPDAPETGDGERTSRSPVQEKTRNSKRFTRLRRALESLRRS